MLVSRSGSSKVNKRDRPRARTHRIAQVDESRPPLNPRTTPRLPKRLTSLRMNCSISFAARETSKCSPSLMLSISPPMKSLSPSGGWPTPCRRETIVRNYDRSIRSPLPMTTNSLISCASTAIGKVNQPPTAPMINTLMTIAERARF
ncbi:hypothetical protein SDC9_65088 [bioreactor metagenome]|uniref:Uncharacterized protein n=1 Tax=bioreactor metagenome TaxID=1076179 RepID=A0A644XRB9_9ZZZZ